MPALNASAHYGALSPTLCARPPRLLLGACCMRVLITARALTPQVLDRRASYWVPAAGSLLAIPFWLGTLNAPTLELSLGSLFIEYVDREPLTRSDCL